MQSLFDVDKTDLLLRVLHRYGVQPRLDRTGWQPIRCINQTAHPHGDRHPSAAINLTFGRYTCHACDLHGDGFQLMLDLEQAGPTQTLVILELQAGGVQEATWIL